MNNCLLHDRSQFHYYNRAQKVVLGLLSHVLYLYIYTALLAVHTSQKRFHEHSGADAVLYLSNCVRRTCSRPLYTV